MMQIVNSLGPEAGYLAWKFSRRVGTVLDEIDWNSVLYVKKTVVNRANLSLLAGLQRRW
jgi:hypothetical protein